MLEAEPIADRRAAMATRLQDKKTDLLERVADRLHDKLDDPLARLAEAFVRQYYRAVPPADRRRRAYFRPPTETLSVDRFATETSSPSSPSRATSL